MSVPSPSDVQAAYAATLVEDVYKRQVLTSKYLLTKYQKGALHDGTEGELYVLSDDPLQRINRFNDPALSDVQSELAERLHDHEVRPGDRATPGVLVAPV